jgi:hypothetical protein
VFVPRKIETMWVQLLIICLIAQVVMSQIDTEETNPFKTHYEDDVISVRPLTGPPGILFTAGENVTFTSTAWHLAFTINISGLGQDLNTMDRIFQEAKSNQSNPLDFRMMKATEQSLKMAEEEYGHLKQEAQQKILTKDGPGKNRCRASFNPLSWITGSFGSVARELFGVASMEDVNNMNKCLDVLLQKIDKLVTLQKLHITALKQIQGEIEKQKTDIRTLVSLTGILFDTVLPSVQNRANLEGVVMFLHGELIATLRTFRSVIGQFIRIIEVLDRGYITPQMIPQEELITALQHIEN